MKTRTGLKIGIPLVAILLLSALFVAGSSAQGGPTGNKILDRQLAIELGQAQPEKWEQHISSGIMYTLLDATGELQRRAEAAGPAPRGQVNPPASASGGCPNKYVGGGGPGGPNTRVNQDCTLRRQAEETIAINPQNPNNLVAGQNDSRIGYNHCGYDFSFDGGKTWGDLLPPFWSFVQLDGHTADACSDPTATFDGDGNAYIGGILFDVASDANSIVVAKSNFPLGGSSYHSPADIAYQTYQTSPLGVVANDHDPNVANDKEFIVADAGAASPKRNNVYATWTRFANTGLGVGGNSPIYFSQSTDGGATWSPGVEISGANATACAVFSGSADPNACDQDQGSHPVVGPDGTIYVAFGNGNTPLLGINQIMMVSCPPGADCSQTSSWTAPVKVGDMYDTSPVGPSPEGCPFGRSCLPPNGYRLTGFVTISASVDQASRLYVSWADFRNGGGSCDWNGGAFGGAATATPPCDNDVFYAYSTDGGASWSATMGLTPAGSAQWQPWSAVTADGTLFVGYYDRSYGDCEFTGCNDITLAKVTNAASATPNVKYTRLTTSSMPNLTPANNPVQAGFLGDYMWVATDAKGTAHVVWADTRGMAGTVEEDIYYASSK